MFSRCQVRSTFPTASIVRGYDYRRAVARALIDGHSPGLSDRAVCRPKREADKAVHLLLIFQRDDSVYVEPASAQTGRAVLLCVSTAGQADRSSPLWRTAQAQLENQVGLEAADQQRTLAVASLS